MADSEGSEPEITVEEGLSAATLAALQAHLATQAEEAEQQDGESLVKENFGMSQFWYDDDTAQAIAQELLLQCPEEGQIAIISAPSVMHALKEIAPEKENVVLLEYDRRFDESYPGKFHYYDFNHPAEISDALHQRFDVILADPPYLTEDTIDAFYSTIKLMCKGRLQESTNKENFAVNELVDLHSTKVLFVTAPKNSNYLWQKYGMGTTPLTLYFASKFATPMRCHSNYRENGFGGWDEVHIDDENNELQPADLSSSALSS